MSDHFKRLIGVGLAVVCMITMTGAITLEESRLSHVSKKLGSQHTQLIESCIRLNIVRAEANISDYADFLFDSKILEDLSKNLRQPPHPQTPVERRQARDFIDVTSSTIAKRTWTPLTDCNAAINNIGAHYRPRRPVRFIDRLPPHVALIPPH